MDCRELIERLAAEIQKAGANKDRVRARKLADLQLDVLAGMSRDVAAEPPDSPSPSLPLSRPVAQQEQTELLGERRIAALPAGLGQLQLAGTLDDLKARQFVSQPGDRYDALDLRS
jgi:hypothetical protein